MAEKSKSKDTPVTNPEPTNESKVNLGQFIEGLKKGIFNTQKTGEAKLEIPSNFMDEFKNISKTLEVLNIKNTQISINTANTIKAVQQLEKNILGSNKILQIKGLENVGKTLEEIKNSISKIKNTTSTDFIEGGKQPSSKPEEVDTAAEALAVEEAKPFKLVSISDDAALKLEGVFKKLNIKALVQEKETPKKKQAVKEESWGDLFSQLLSKVGLKDLLAKSTFGKMFTTGLLSSLAGLGGSLALALNSWFNDGPFKGTMKVIGEIGTKVFLPKVTKILTEFFPAFFGKITTALANIGKSVGGVVTKIIPTAGVLGTMATKFLSFLTPILKRLPVIGTIINIGSAISRFMKGDIIGGLIDIGSAVAVTIPFAGTAISIGLGLLNAGRDLSGGGLSENAKSQSNVSIKDFFGKATDWIKERVKSIVKVVTGMFTAFGKNISEAWDNTIEWFKDLPSSIMEEVSKAWDKTKNFLSDKWNSLKNIVKNLIDKPGLLIKNIWDNLTSWIDGALNGIENFFENPLDSLKVMWENVTAKIKEAIMAPVNAVKKGWEKITGWFGGLNEKEQSPEKIAKDTSKLLGTNVITSTEAPKEIVNETKVNTVAPEVAKVVPENTEAVKKTVEETKTETVVPSITNEINAKDIAKIAQPVLSGNQLANIGVATPQIQVPNNFTQKEKVESSLKEPESLIEKFKAPTTETPQVTLVRNKLQTIPTPLASLESPTNTSVTAINDLKMDLIEALNSKTSTPEKTTKSTTVATVGNTNTTAVSNSTNIFSSTLDRDIPYIERNKYRQTIIYNRNLL